MVRDSLRKFFSAPLRHNKDAEKRVRLLTTLNEITQQLTSTLELEPLLQYIVENAVKILDCEAGSLFLVDEQTQELVFKVAIGPVAADLLGQRLAPGVGIVGHAAQMRQPVIENDVQHSKIYQNSWDQNTRFITRSLMVVPMLAKDRVIGLLEVLNRRDGRSFVADDQSLLVAFAGQAGIAIENARLFQMTQANEEKVRELNISLEKRVLERTNQLQAEKAKIEKIAEDVATLRQLSDFLQSCETIAEAGDVIAKHMSVLFGAANGALYLASETSELCIAAAWGQPGCSDEIAPNACWGMRRGRFFYKQHGDASPVCTHFSVSPMESLCLPLLAQGEAIGMICLYVTKEEDVHVIEDMQNLAVTGADSIALALANLRLRERLRDQAIRDSLTGLFNKRFMTETLDREIHRAMRTNHPLSVIMLEIDNFRIYNNTHGHEAGNYVVRKLSDTIRGVLRRGDFPCRYGGDEFTIILPETTLSEAAQKAEELRKAIQAMALTYNNQALGTVTVSAGLAAFPQHGDTGERVFNSADAACYKAKVAGKNCVVTAE